MKFKYLFSVVILIACFAVSPGCSPSRVERPDRALVTGTVTYQGKPVTGGDIFFTSTSDSGNSAGGMIKPDGTYRLENAPIGTNQVTVDTETIKPYLGSNYIKLPDKYLSPEKSGLTFDVKAGENKDVNFTLEGE